MTTTTRRTVRRTATAFVGAAFATVLLASPAGAHVHPNPETVPAGEEATVAFVVGHGCDGEATDRVEIRVPDVVTEFSAGELDGWEASTDGQVVTYAGGPLDDHSELGFPVTFTAPGEAQSLLFPVIQYCGDLESAWISEDHEADDPAPVVEVEGTATTETTADPEATTSTEAGAGSAPTTTEATDGTAPDVEPISADVTDEADDDDSSSTVPIVIGVIVVLALAGGGIAYARSRKGDVGDE